MMGELSGIKMTLHKRKEFDSIAQRVLYGFLLVYSDFAPIDSDMATGYKTLYEFYRFLYIAALHDEMNGGSLCVSNETLKANKTGYKPIYNKLLNEVGVEIVKESSGVTIHMDSKIAAALKLLAVKVPTGVNPWTRYELADFARCSFTGDKEYLFMRMDHINGLNGLLMDLRSKCLEKGYTEEWNLHFTSTDLGVAVYFKNAVGGFQIVYNSRKYWQFSFGTMNGIGEKAMLEDFDHLDDDIKRHFLSICRPCSGCRVCTKNGKNKIFTIHARYDGKEYNLCPSFPAHSWETLDNGMMDVLFKYHDLQVKYG